MKECIGGDEEEGAVLVFIAAILLLPADPPAAAHTKSLLSSGNVSCTCHLVYCNA